MRNWPIRFTFQRLGIALVFALMFAAFVVVFHPFFPIGLGFVGKDYSFFLPSLLAGHFWFRNNGIMPPWFTPYICAGQPFFADIPAGYYSLPQFLSFIVSPLTAVYWTLLISAALMFWGGYFLMRRVFESTVAVAVLVGGLLMFNGFLSHRMLIGHLGYHGFALVPWISLLLLMPAHRKVDSAAAAIGAGLLLTYWVQSGFSNLILAGGLAVALVLLLHGLRGGSLARFFFRGALAGMVGIGLSAAKLWATASFMANFPRTDYLLPGAASIHDAFIMIAGMLFLPPQWAFELGNPRYVNVQWRLGAHEWAFNFSMASVLLALVLIADLVRKGAWRVSVSPRQFLLLAFMMLGLIWPLAFNVYYPAWNAFLKTVPVINTTSTALRWLIVYIPVIAIGIGLLLERVKWGRAGTVAVGLCLLATVIQVAIEPRRYYLEQEYDARPVIFADQRLRAEKRVPSIEALGTSAIIHAGQNRIRLEGNDTFIAGISQVFCYSPIFGYRLEKFSADGLAEDSVFARHDGLLNLKNPACYVFPKENNCQPGERFRVDQLAEAKSFVGYRPYPFQISTGQKAANLVTELTLALVVIAFLAWLRCRFRRHD